VGEAPVRAVHRQRGGVGRFIRSLGAHAAREHTNGRRVNLAASERAGARDGHCNH
jgi:hypothetical protein